MERGKGHVQMGVRQVEVVWSVGGAGDGRRGHIRDGGVGPRQVDEHVGALGAEGSLLFQSEPNKFQSRRENLPATVVAWPFGPILLGRWPVLFVTCA